MCRYEVTWVRYNRFNVTRNGSPWLKDVNDGLLDLVKMSFRYVTVKNERPRWTLADLFKDICGI